jgi:hypothetical protein
LHKIITINRKDTKGTISVDYKDWVGTGAHVWISFRGARGGSHGGEWFSLNTLPQVAQLLVVAGKADPAARKSITDFCYLLKHNIANKLSMWLANAEELSAALMTINHECNKVKEA